MADDTNALDARGRRALDAPHAGRAAAQRAGGADGPARRPRGRRRRRRGLTARATWAVALAGAALLLVLAPGGVLGLRRDVPPRLGVRPACTARAPEYDVLLAPTPHPLLVLGAVAGGADRRGGGRGDAGHRALLAAGALGAGMCRIGWRLAGPVAGIAAAAVLLLSPPVVELVHEGGRGPARARAGRLGRGGGARAPAARAGARARACWRSRGCCGRRRGCSRSPTCAVAAPAREPRLVALALAAPVLWALTDLVVTGDPLWSLSHTRDGTELLDRETGLGAALELLPRHVNFLVGPFVLAAAAVGAVTRGAARAVDRSRPAALIVAGFLVLAAAGLSPAGALPRRDRRGRGAARGDRADRPLALGRRARCSPARWSRGGRPRRRPRAARRRRAAARGARPRGRRRRARRSPCRRSGRCRSSPTGRTGGRARSSRAPPGPRGSLISPTGESESWIGGGGPGQPPRVEVAPPPGYAPRRKRCCMAHDAKC